MNLGKSEVNRSRWILLIVANLEVKVGESESNSHHGKFASDSEVPGQLSQR